MRSEDWALLELMLAQERYDAVAGPWRIRPSRWLASVAIEWKPEDLWIGAFWKRTPFDGFVGYSLWICLLPCFPLHIWWYKRDEAALTGRTA